MPSQLPFDAEVVLSTMIRKAEELDVLGVAVYTRNGYSTSDQQLFVRIRGGYQGVRRNADPSFSENDIGTNRLAIALGKIAQMCMIGRSSGKQTMAFAKGEFGYRGGVMSDNRLMAAFSGGTEDQDVEIAKAGLAAIGATVAGV